MEGDDTAWAGIAFDVVHHVLGRHPFGVVASDEIPHHDPVLAVQQIVLNQSHPAVGRPKQVSAYVGIGMLHIV